MIHPQDLEESTDPAATVVTKMREQGISSLPRNYELVYRFLNTSNAALIREYAALGKRPTQSQLDAVGMKFLPHHHPTRAIELSLEGVFDEMLGMIRMFKQDQSKLQSYSDLLDETSERMAEKKHGLDVLDELSRVLSSATGDTMAKSEAVIRQMIERAKELARLKSELEEYKRLASIDQVTRLSNRRAFDKRIEAIYQDKHSAKTDALLIADIDHFKTFNDTYGHQVGDRVLSVTGAMMNKALGDEAFIARTGGEEFAVILDNTNLQDAQDTAEYLRQVIEAVPLKDQNDGLDCGRVTISLGLCMAADATSAEELYSKADMVLYQAKKAGRNQLKTYTPKMQKLRALLKR